MKSKTHLLTSACLAAVIVCGPSLAFAAPKSSPSPTASPAAAKASAPAASDTAKTARALPFHGTATAVDQSAKTFTIAGKTNSRVFKVTDKTTVTKNGSSATMTDLTENEAVSGSYWKQEDGTLELKSLTIGPKAKTEKSSSKKAKTDATTESPAASPSASPKK